jgi:peptidyl-prolyl cis-trans isomerase D
MLQFIRSKAGSLIVKILFVLLIACFGLWGVGDFIRQLPNDTAVITVGSIKIKPPEIQNEIQRGIDAMKPYFGGNIDRSQARQLGIVDRAVNELIDQSIMDQEIDRLRLTVGDGQIADIIQSDPTFHGKDGQFDREILDGLLAEHKLNENQYMAMLRRQVPRQGLLQVVAGNARTPYALSAMLYRKRAEKRAVDYVFLDGSGLPPVARPTDAQLQEFYKQNLSSFTAPEYRRVTVLTLTTADVINQVTVSDDKLQDYYQQNLEEFSKPETRDVSHMLLPDEATVKLAEAALQSGKSFEQVAKTIAHQDPDTLKLGLITRQMLPGDLAGPAFSTPAGKISAPVKTQFGWSIVKINAVNPAHVVSYADAKAQVTREAKASAANDALYQLSNRVEDAIAAGADLGAIAQQFNLKPLTIDAIDASGKGPDGLPLMSLPVDTASLTKLVFQSTQGQLSPLTQSQDGKSFVVRVDGVIPATPRPYDKVKADVATAWAAAQRDRQVADEATALAHAASGGVALANLAKGKHLAVASTKPFARDDSSAASPLPGDMVAHIFTLKPGESTAAAGSLNGKSGQFVVQLSAIRLPNPASNPGEVSQLGQQVGKQLGGELLQAFNNSLRTHFPVKINQPALDAIN